MAPGKGVHLVLNEAVLEFVKAALEDISKPYTDDLHDSKPETVITLLTDPEEDAELDLAWYKEKDNFGTKAIAFMPYKDGELRVTIVLTKKGELRLDIREWYDPS